MLNSKTGPPDLWQEFDSVDDALAYVSADKRAEDNGLSAGEVFSRCYREQREATEQEQVILAADPFWAYYYCDHVTHCRFPRAEPVISTDGYSSYNYAKCAVQPGDFVPDSKRFPLGELEIAKDTRYFHFYATDVLKDRWERVVTDPAVLDAYWRTLESSYLKDMYNTQFPSLRPNLPD